MELLQGSKQLIKLRYAYSGYKDSTRGRNTRRLGKINNCPNMSKKRRFTRLQKLQRHEPTEHSRESLHKTKQNEVVC